MMKIPNGNDWKCFACANFEQNNPVTPNIGSVNSIKCELCPRVGGALSRTSKGKWVHTFCSSWIPGTQWFNKSCIFKIFQNLTLVIAAVSVNREENEMVLTIAMHVCNVPTQNVIANFTLCAQSLQTAIITEKL